MVIHMRPGIEQAVQSWALRLDCLGCNPKAATHQMFAFGQDNQSFMLSFLSKKEHINVRNRCEDYVLRTNSGSTQQRSRTVRVSKYSPLGGCILALSVLGEPNVLFLTPL